MSPEIRRRRRSRGFRRLQRQVRRFARSHPRRTVAIGVGAVVVVALGWSLWVVSGAARDLREVDDQARLMRDALVQGDAAGARDALRAYQAAADSADDTTHGLTWSVFGAVPLLGDDARGVATAAEVLAAVGRDGLTPVVDAADQVTADSFQPVQHTFPLDRIAALEEPAARSEKAFDTASRRLAVVDSAGFVGPIRTAFDGLRDLVDDARGTLQSTYRASRLIPRLLGRGEARNYLLVLQNNAESRSSGGLPGSLSLIHARDGKVDIVRQVDMAELGATPGHPVLPLSTEEEQLFGEILGTVGVDATLTPDIPRASELIRARWEQVEGQRLDGVLYVDPVVVSYLLAAIGEVPVPGYAPVNAANVVGRVENEIYALTPGTQAQSDYQEAVAKAVFDVFSDGRGDSADLIRGLVTGVEEGRVRMHFFAEDAQREIAGTSIAGEFVDRTDGPPLVGIYVNDAGPTKMQYYLRQRATLYSRSCAGGRQQLGVTLSFTNATPPLADELPDAITGEFFPGNRTDPGQQLLVVYVSAPVGGAVEEVTVDGQDTGNPTVTTYAGREVATIGVLLDPGQSRKVDVQLRTAKGDEADPRLEMSPGAAPGTSNATASSACHTR
ncbi:DUF4012 domain-containing protein [Nocardioides nitrophenolicus]|uniref:DUF4012 domain-containing protein n=1 Tax=Nocardioides nitrophenolicus TaxID=60489 RepID=UPI001959B303|nr:DUF4012 domain-containing protein [Nocardioides nitrophenolicus]MBM7516563.1 hypothetical protein [Nocardioides nitrophenolicus]